MFFYVKYSHNFATVINPFKDEKIYTFLRSIFV
jgi:hypothetical protein